MQLRESKIGWIGMVAGTSGVSLAFLMIWWMVGVNYPNIAGGKPFFNIPASIPIMFELTVLVTALTLVGSLILLYLKLPSNSDPIMDTDFLRSVTSDKFGIYIEAKDAKFNADEVRALFEGLGSSTVSNIYFPDYDIGKTKNPLLDKKFVGVLAGTAIATALVTHLALNVIIFLPPFSWMHYQPRVDPQTESKFFKDGFSMRRPVDGTVARGFMPYEFKGMPDSMVVVTPNPLPVNQKVLELGKKRFGTYCSPCHGYYGRGDSRLRGQFPAPPSLLSQKVTNWKDANIYHVITNGQNVMPSYASSVSRNDRWAIIHYIRALQRSQNASDSDLVGK